MKNTFQRPLDIEMIEALKKIEQREQAERGDLELDHGVLGRLQDLHLAKYVAGPTIASGVDYFGDEGLPDGWLVWLVLTPAGHTVLESFRLGSSNVESKA